MMTLTIATSQREALMDITPAVRDMVQQQGWQNGALILFCPHTTCGLTINEGADPDVARDMTAFFRKLVPQSADFHHAEGNSDAHIKASIMGASLHLIVENGKLRLGTWQAVYLFEGDGPRKRSVWGQWLGM